MQVLKRTSTQLIVGKKNSSLGIMALILTGILLVGLLFFLFALDTFIDDSQGLPKLFLSIFFGLFFLFGVCGLFSIIKAPSELICVFNKTLNQMVLKYSQEDELQHSLDNIAGIKVENWENTYRVNLTLVSGESLPLTYVYSSEQKEKQQIAVCIQEFLELK